MQSITQRLLWKRKPRSTDGKTGRERERERRKKRKGKEKERRLLRERKRERRRIKSKLEKTYVIEEASGCDGDTQLLGHPRRH